MSTRTLLKDARTGVFALNTSLVLIDFKLNHPKVHNMGDTGKIVGGPILGEILAAGTVIFAVCATGSQLLAGQITLGVLSDNKLCLMWYTGYVSGAPNASLHACSMTNEQGMSTIPTLLLSFPKTLDQLSWLCIPSCICILVAGVVGMAVAGTHTAPDRHVDLANSASFYDVFLSITNPVFSYAGHFMFFILISEIKGPQDTKKATWVSQTFATT